ncbi:MAG: cupin domain-containing protein [Phycisphaerae bacterium]|nr:cupin domain-containing protein [Phycisphaerae bacterium]
MPESSVMTWSDLPADFPMPLIERRRVMGTHMMISKVRLSKGFHLATHHHPNEQMVCVLSGRAEFVLDEGAPTERRVTLTDGQVLVLPPNAPHGCFAHEDTDILDVFSPPSATTGVDRS